MRFLALAALFLLGCPSRYSSRTLATHGDVDPASFQSNGCLEVALGLLPRAHAEDAALLLARFGNNCLHPTPFNLAAARFSGIDTEGRTVTLYLVDPRNEIQPLHLDAGAHGDERVRLAGSKSVPLVAICVSLNVEPSAAPFCFRPSSAYFGVTS